jgi:hypothetical protein
MLVDPYPLERASMLFSPEEMAKNQERIIASSENMRKLQQMLVSSISAEALTAPVSVLVVKGDRVINNQQGLRNTRLQTNPAVVNPESRITFDGNYIKKQNQGAKEIISALSSGIVNTIEATFKNVNYMLVSSIGLNVEIVQKEGLDYLDNPSNYKPWRIRESCARLLMSMGLLPPYDEMKGRPLVDETQEERESRTRENIEMINKWGCQNCYGWKNIPIPTEGSNR